MIFNNYAALHNGMYDSYKDSPADAVAEFGVKTGLALTASFFAKYVPTGIPLEKLRYLNEYTMLDPATGNYIAYANWFEKNGGSIKRATSSATIKELIWNSIKFAEEQLFKIPRTFSASSYVGMNTIKDFEFIYDANSPTIQNQMKYLEAISEGKINKMTIGKQVKFSGGKLYSISETGEESVLLKNATAIPFEWGRNTPTKYISKFAKALFEQHGMSAPKDLDFIFTGGNDWLKGAKEKLGGFSTAAIENYVKLLDDPFGLLREVLDSSGHHLPRIDKLLTKGSAILDKVFMKDMLGVGGFNNMKNRSAMQLMKLHFNKITPMAIMGIGAYKVVNAVLQDAFDTDLKGMGAQVYQDVSKGISAVSDYTGLTLLGKAQEELAPGSSKLSALAAIPVSMAIMGGTLGAITNAAAKEAIGEVAQGPNWFRGLMTNLETTPGVIGEVAEKLSFSKLGRSGAYGAMGAIVGAALVAPFIPGALGDQYTLEERKDLYSGEEYVAHKRGRFWEFGCVKEDTPITTDKGIKPIIEVEEGDLVLTHEGEWKKVYACVRQSMDNKRLFKVKPYMSDEYIEITGNHEVPSMINGIIKDRPVYDLINSDSYVGFPIIKNSKTINHINTLRYGSIRMGYDLGKLIGLYLVHGQIITIGENSSYIEFSLNKENYFARFDIIKSMRKVFDINPAYSYDSDNIILTYFASDVANWISSIDTNLFSETHLFNHCDNDNFYIGILFGSMSYEKAIAYYNGSLDSCLFLRNISLNLGIVPELKYNEDNQAYMLVWRKSEFAKLNNLFSNIDIEIKSCYYKDVAFIEDDTFWMKIESIEEVEKPKFVYDLAVEDHKTYTTTAFTIHNTSPFEGDQTLFYAPHWTVRAKTDAVRKGILPEKDYNSQLAYLMKRLVDPYYLEKATDKERPYTYWGASDMGLGIFETLATPIVHAFKPTIVAHREAVGKLHPSQLKRSDIYIPDEAKGNDRIKTRGYAREADDPSSTSALMGKLLADVEHVFGIQGYAVDNLKNLFTGGNSPFVPEAISESSGRMMSANRLFWQMGLGGGASSTEAYRRLNPQRPYETQYLMSPIRNTMPEWIGREDLKYGDAFSAIPYGDIRLPGRGYCVHPETKVLTDNGFKEIQNIEINDNVLTSEGYKTVDNKFAREYSGEVISIKSYGSITEPTKLTPEHMVKAIKINKCKYHNDTTKSRRPCKKGNFCERMKCANHEYMEIEWIQAKDLEQGDYVLFPKNNEYNESDFEFNIVETVSSDLVRSVSDGLFRTYRQQNNKIIPNKYINFNLEDNDKTWWLIGLWLAEGWIKLRRTTPAGISLVVAKHEYVFVEYLSEIFNNVKAYDHDTYYTIDINNKIAGIYFNETFGSSVEKHIPRNLNYDQFIQLLSGLMQGDGSRDKQAMTLVVAFSHERLFNDIIWYLIKFNIAHSIKTRKDKQCFEIRVMSSSIEKLNIVENKQIEYSSSKTISNFEIQNHMAFKIYSIEKEQYSGVVYDIEVRDTHEFTTSFIVHNSALHPELQGLDPEDYPAIHRMNILADVAPMSPGFYEAKANVENQMAHGELSRDSEALYDRIMEQRKEIREGPKFDYGGNPVGDYWLSLKQLGRSLPTESLYPLSPVHKFSGPVDPVTDYKSFNVLDKQFKSWDNPITDYAKPTWNRAIDFFGYGDFTPMETKEHSQIESYFMGLQFAKNNILSDKATEAFKDGQYQLASFYRKGLRPTLHGMSPYEDAQDLDALMPDREKGYLEAFMNDPDKSRQASSLKITTPYMSQALKGQFLKEDLEERREYDKLQEIQVDAPAIRGVSLNEFTGSQIPERNFVGYAPGVDLNALKVKTVNHLGQNIRDYSLWREDEIAAQLLDKSMGGLSPYNVFDYANREHSAGIYNLQKKLYQLGNRDMQITAVPTGGSSSINFNIKRDNRQDLKDVMQQEGYISY